MLFSPLLSLARGDFENYSNFGKGHSIYNMFRNFNENAYYIDIVSKVFKNKAIEKTCFSSENDYTVPHKFNESIFNTSINLVTFKFLNTRLHNFFSLFYFGHTKNFEKFKTQSWYVDQNELSLLSNKIWGEDITLDTLSNSIINKTIKTVFNFDFIQLHFFPYL